MNYSSIFQPTGVNPNLNGCIDTDGDGIVDVIDIKSTVGGIVRVEGKPKQSTLIGITCWVDYLRVDVHESCASSTLIRSDEFDDTAFFTNEQTVVAGVGQCCNAGEA